MIQLLNRGFNFSPIPKNLDFTQVLADFRRFERRMIWKEFWFDDNDDEDNSEERRISIFKKEKTNLPKKYNVPNGLKTYLVAVKSDITDPKNRIKVSPNISKPENEALSELIKLQREHKIVIKPSDKGSGIVVLNFSDYIQSCEDHLISKHKENNSYYYAKTNEAAIKEKK